MRLDRLTWPEVGAYLDRANGILLPVGSTEQHGPNGPLGTDALCPEAVGQVAAERLGILVAPTLALGVAPYHMAFPGTITLSPETFQAVLRETVGSLARHGFAHVYVLNGHGGNIPFVREVLKGLESPRCKLHSWFAGPRVRALAKELYGKAEGTHATPSEIALAWHYAPETRREGVAMTPKCAPGGFEKEPDAYRARFPDGRIGSDASLARAEDGARLLEAAVGDVVEDYRAFTG